MRTFAELLTLYMERTGIGDAELARRIPVSRPTLIRWKEGVTTRPRYREDVARCAELLRLTPPETDEFLLAAGFSPETAPAPSEPRAPSGTAATELAAREPAQETLPTKPATPRRPPLKRRGVLAAAAVAALVVVVVVLAAVLRDGTEYPSALDGSR